MATKPSGVLPATSSQQPFIVMCGPSPEAQKKLPNVRKFLRHHLVASSLFAAFGLFCLGSWWAVNDFPGREGLTDWGCEILAGVLSLLVIVLSRTFRRWGLERAMMARARRERNEELSALRQTPPPLETGFESHAPHRDTIAITIEQWRSHVPAQLSEDYLQRVQLPDEVLAPDALVLQVERKEAL